MVIGLYYVTFITAILFFIYLSFFEIEVVESTVCPMPQVPLNHYAQMLYKKIKSRHKLEVCL